MSSTHSIRHAVVSVVAAISAFALVGCSTGGSSSAQSSGASADPSTTTITVGFTAGPYEDEWNDAIAPQLEKKGYTVKTQSFTDYIQADAALAEGSIQANIIQHTTYLDYVNGQRGFSNEPLVQVPGPPMGLFAGKSSSLDVADGASVAVPSDPSNLYRALLLLQKAGWITVSDTIDSGTASLNDITANPHNLSITLMDSSQGIRALQDLDYGVVQGNFAVSAGLDLTSALSLETLEDRFKVVVAVGQDQSSTQWATDIVEAYHSSEFTDYIRSDDRYKGYDLPDYFGAESGQ